MSKAPIAVRLPEARTLSVGGNQGRGDPLATNRLRTFRVEVEADGEPFVWTGHAANEQSAFREAAAIMVSEFPMVEPHQVQLRACIEVAP